MALTPKASAPVARACTGQYARRQASASPAAAGRRRRPPKGAAAAAAARRAGIAARIAARAIMYVRSTVVHTSEQRLPSQQPLPPYYYRYW